MNNEKPTYYAILTSSVRYDNNLSPNSKLLYAEITALSEASGNCWASDSYFMNLYKVTRRTIQNWLKELEEGGYIKRQVIYKSNSKEIEKRYITLVNINAQGYGKNMHKGMEKICTDNTTSTNNTSINNNIVPFKEIIDYLNEKASTKFRLVESNKKFIRARWNEGYRFEDFKKVVDNKVAEWKGTDMDQYLRPSTLFGTKFDNYLNQATKKIDNYVAPVPEYETEVIMTDQEEKALREKIKAMLEDNHES